MRTSSADALTRAVARRLGARRAPRRPARSRVRRTGRARAAPRRARASSGRRIGSSSASSATARRNRFAAACMSPRANARRPADARRRDASRPISRAFSSSGPSSREIAVRLLEVVAEDLLELEAAAALGVDLVGPAHEVDVQRRAGALEQAVVDGVAHQVMVEAVAADLGPSKRHRRARTACASAPADGSSIAGRDALGRQRCDRRRGNCRPITDAGSIVARSSRRAGRVAPRAAP